MLRYIGKRMIGLVIVLLGVVALSFVIANVSTVDPVEAYKRMTGANTSKEEIEAMREEMGLDQPIHIQFVNWLGDAVRFDFGKSFVTKNDAMADLLSRLPYTLLQVVVAMAFSVLVIVPIGILSAIKKGTLFDKVVHALTLAGASFPPFWLGYMLLLLFAVQLKILPVTSYGQLSGVILPAITLAVPIISINVRMLRANVLDNLNQDYVLYAKARGLSNRKIVGKHVLKNAAAPMITILGQTFGYTVAGAVIVENVFAWPGVGGYAVSAIIARDLPVVNAYVILIALIFVVCNLLADIAQIAINPKLLTEGGDL